MVFTAPLGEEAFRRDDTGEYMHVDGDFALGNRGRKEDDATYIRLCQTQGDDYLNRFGLLRCMSAGCLKTGVLWGTHGIPNAGAQRV